MQSPRGANAAEIYHKMGIKVFTTSKNDDLFLGVKLPEGWKKEATDHPLYTKLVDDKGSIRATIFYKAAYYDREAFVNFRRRFTSQPHYPSLDTYTCFVVDNVTREHLFETTVIPAASDYDKREELRDLCETFLNTYYPDHENPCAYW